tara:strand:+ start:565 stop:822 length:258 start_codon:yes stop_codon:yes gene_type:complete
MSLFLLILIKIKKKIAKIGNIIIKFFKKVLKTLIKVYFSEINFSSTKKNSEIYISRLGNIKKIKKKSKNKKLLTKKSFLKKFEFV